MKYKAISLQVEVYGVNRLCQTLGVSRSGYYAWRGRTPSEAQRGDSELSVEINAIFKQSRETYGSPRIYQVLQERGISCSRRRVARLMRENGLQARRKRRKAPRTTIADDTHPVAPNLLEQDFSADYPHEKWVADITYINTHQGWLYLAAVLDIYTRQIVGWTLDDHLREELIEGAFLMGVGRCHPPAGLIHHSDRGSQYTSSAYQLVLAEYQVIASMSRTGNCYDNAMMESFFSTLKQECVTTIFSSHQ